MFDTSNVNSCLPHHVNFQIQVTYYANNIFRKVFYEVASMLIMSMSCWRDLGSLPCLTISDPKTHLLMIL